MLREHRCDTPVTVFPNSADAKIKLLEVNLRTAWTKTTPFGGGTSLGRPHTIVAEELLDARDVFKPVMND